MPVPAVEYGQAIAINGKRYVVVPNPIDTHVEPYLVQVEVPTIPGLYTAKTPSDTEVVLLLDGYGKWQQLDFATGRHGTQTPNGLATMTAWSAMYLQNDGQKR